MRRLDRVEISTANQNSCAAMDAGLFERNDFNQTVRDPLTPHSQKVER
jgi:hypothetical protein